MNIKYEIYYFFITISFWSTNQYHLTYLNVNKRPSVRIIYLFTHYIEGLQIVVPRTRATRNVSKPLFSIIFQIINKIFFKENERTVEKKIRDTDMLSFYPTS